MDAQMATSIYPEHYPPALSDQELQLLCSEINDWAIAHGLAVRPSPSFVSQDTDPVGVLATTAPVTLFPSLFPKACFEEALRVQKAYNLLYAAIARDEEWLEGVIKEVAAVDDFIEKLWNIHLEVKKEGYAQDLDLGLFRSDYMVHAEPQEGPPTLGIRQVEFNTISSSFGGLSGLVSKLHATLPRLAGSLPWHPDRASLPHNFSTMGLAAGLVSAWKTYDQAQPPGRPPACVLFVVQDAERNVFDQRHLQHGLTARSIPVFRMPFSSTLRRTEIGADPGRALIYTRPDGARYEVAVLYFRATYAPSEFPDAASWRARLHLERSAAIKCPSILTHIAGCKKVQQVLATPSSTHLERFLPSPADCAAVRATFAAMYPLDDSPAGHRAKALATSPAESQRFVLKPQREGGGNNVYRGAIPPFLAGLGGEARWRGYVLMELIEPPAQRNTILREGRTQTGEVVCELGVFGTCLWRRSSGEVLRNEEAGYLLRTKGRESEEGGVAAGFGAIDSVALVDV